MRDDIEELALDIIKGAHDVLETKEIQESIESSNPKLNVTRTKLFARLNNLRGEGLIKGKFVGPGKGVWVWWHPAIFSDNSGGKK